MKLKKTRNRIGRLNSSRRLKKLLFILLTCWGLFGLLFGCEKKSAEVSKASLYLAKKQRISQSILISGKLEPLKKAIVFAPVSGAVQSLKQSLGNRIKPGDPLFEYDVESLKKQLENLKKTMANAINTKKIADEKLETARQSLKKMKDLHSRGKASRHEVEEAEGQVRFSEHASATCQKEWEDHEKNLKGLEDWIAHPVVTSGMEGVVVTPWKESETFVSGAVVNLNDPLMMIADLSSFEVSGRVLESEVSRLKGNETATITVSAARTEPYSGKVSQVVRSPIIDPHSSLGTYPVSVTLSKPDDQLRPGMSAEVSIQVESKDQVIVVPITVIQTESGKDWVEVSRGGTLSKQWVKVGLTNDVSAEIVEGIQEGEMVRVP